MHRNSQFQFINFKWNYNIQSDECTKISIKNNSYHYRINFFFLSYIIFVLSLCTNIIILYTHIYLYHLRTKKDEILRLWTFLTLVMSYDSLTNFYFY